MDVSIDDPVALTQALVRIDSSNPTLGSVPGPREAEIARFISSWLKHRNIEVHWIEPTKGRPSVIVTTLSYDGDGALSGEIKDGKLYGRGAYDMKSGIAAAMIALASANGQNLRGGVIFTGVADEESMRIGTEQVLAAGWVADGAIVNEPTNEAIGHAHNGFVWLEVDIYGLASHGSLPSVGIDAITGAGYFLVEIDKYQGRLRGGHDDPDDFLMAPSVHASTIKGGEEASTYPELCTITLERRTIAKETLDSVCREVKAILDGLVTTVRDFIKRAFWTDCALLASEGIPVVLLGPNGDGPHAKEEWVDVDSIQRVAKCLSLVVKRFCS